MAAKSKARKTGKTSSVKPRKEKGQAVTVAKAGDTIGRETLSDKAAKILQRQKTGKTQHIVSGRISVTMPVDPSPAELRKMIALMGSLIPPETPNNLDNNQDVTVNQSEDSPISGEERQSAMEGTGLKQRPKNLGPNSVRKNFTLAPDLADAIKKAANNSGKTASLYLSEVMQQQPEVAELLENS